MSDRHTPHSDDALLASPTRLRKKGSRCDSCGRSAPDVVGPILIGCEGWGTYAIDGVYEGVKWEASVLLCGVRPLGGRKGGCMAVMEAFLAGKGGRPRIVTTEGGWMTEDEFAASLREQKKEGPVAV